MPTMPTTPDATVQPLGRHIANETRPFRHLFFPTYLPLKEAETGVETGAVLMLSSGRRRGPSGQFQGAGATRAEGGESDARQAQRALHRIQPSPVRLAAQDGQELDRSTAQATLLPAVSSRCTALWRSGNGVTELGPTVHRARLVLGWVTVFGVRDHREM